MEIKPRNTQTCVKHEILMRYLDTWGGIIVSGLKSAKRPRDWHFVYVDCFSYLGKYSGEKEDIIQGKIPEKPIYGSPIIGIKALDSLQRFARQKMGVNIIVNTILVEKDKKTFDGLTETLDEAGYNGRVIYHNQFIDLKDGEISVINEDSTAIVDNLIKYTAQPDVWAFYLLDPYGPNGIPYEFVKKIVSQEHHDVMINFIYEDLLRKTGLCLKDNLKPEHKQLLDNWSKAFGGDWWIAIAKEALLNNEYTKVMRDVLGDLPLNDEDAIRLTGYEPPEIKEQKFVSAYSDALRSMDSSLVTKLVSLKFSDKDRTMFYLFLTTHDATGALTLNRLLDDAKYLEHELRYRLFYLKRTAPPPGQLTLFPNEEINIPEPERISRPSIDEIEKTILSSFSERQVAKKEIYKELANSIYFPEEIDKAIRHLRRDKKVHFDGDLKHKTLVTFEKSS